MRTKVAYRIKNWSQYNQSLVNRGNITLWFNEDAQGSWYAKNDIAPGQGRQKIYSDQCIELALTIRSVLRLPLRATQGFLCGLVNLLGLDLRVPHYSRFSRRAKDLEIQITRMRERGKEPTDLVIDSTGLKIYGEGEWKMRTHGKQKRRTWRKYHVAVDPKTHEVIAVELTQANIHDSEAVPALMEGLEDLGNVYGDGAYPTKNSLDAITKAGGFAVIPPRTGTCIVKDPSPGEEQRNRLVRERRNAGGKKAWKKESGYHRRSLVETHMFRLKTILGGSLKSRVFANQITEARIMASILNKMTSLGMPRTEAILLKT